MSYGKSFDFLFNQMRNGSVGSLAAGKVYFYNAGNTTVPKNVFLDRPMTQLAANPYTLTADGTAELFGSGLYRVVVKDLTDVVIYDYDYVEVVNLTEDAVGTTNADIIYVDASDDPYTLTVPLQDDVIVIRTDNTANTVELLPPTGYTFYGGQTFFLTTPFEAVQLRRSGLIYYIIRGAYVLPYNPLISDVIIINRPTTAASISWTAGVQEVQFIRIDSTGDEVTITPPVGTTCFGGNPNLTVAGESCRLLLSGTVYYTVG